MTALSVAVVLRSMFGAVFVTTASCGVLRTGLFRRRYHQRRPDWRRVKKHRSYAVDEVARTLGISKGTVRRWIKSGLSALTDQKPMLILGADLIDFGKTRRRPKSNCAPDRRRIGGGDGNSEQETSGGQGDRAARPDSPHPLHGRWQHPPLEGRAVAQGARLAGEHRNIVPRVIDCHKFSESNFSERRKAAAGAKKAMVERFRAQPAASDPAVMERKAARVAASRERTARIASREVARRAETERQTSELKAREDAAARLALNQAESLAAERRADAERAVDHLAEQKAARDLRYAARKARRR
jgi:hypothetical protein